MSEAPKPQRKPIPLPSRRFRRGMSTALVATGMAAGAAGHAVVSNAQEYNNRPTCEFEATPYGINSPSAAADKLAGAGADVTDAELSIYASSDGHQRRRDTDPVDHRGNIVVSIGDHLDVGHIDPMICIAAGGKVVGPNVHVDFTPKSDHVVEAAKSQPQK